MYKTDVEIIEQSLNQIELQIGLLKEERSNDNEFHKFTQLITELLCGKK